MAPKPEPPHYRHYRIILRHTTVGRTPLDECSARRKELYLTKYNNYKSKSWTIHASLGFEPTIRSSERPQTHSLEHATNEFGTQVSIYIYIYTGIYRHTQAYINIHVLTRTFRHTHTHTQRSTKRCGQICSE